MATQYNFDTTASELVKTYAPLIKDKVVLTTGVTINSIGSTYVEAVSVAQPRLLILAGRTQSKLDEAAARITACPVRTLVVDLASFASVRKAADTVLGWDDVPALDVVHCNAGIMAVPYKLSEDGFEMQFAANHLGHFLFVNLLMRKILAAKQPHVVAVSSDGHRASPVRFDDYNFDVSRLMSPTTLNHHGLTVSQSGNTYSKWTAYGQSKTANMLFALSLAEKFGPKGLQAFSLHPGVIMSTNLAEGAGELDSLCKWSLTIAVGEQKLLMKINSVEHDKTNGYSLGWTKAFKLASADQGAATSVYASFEPTLHRKSSPAVRESEP